MEGRAVHTSTRAETLKDMGIASSQSQKVTAPGSEQVQGGAMAMVTTLFFMWGFLTCLNDILIPHLKEIFDLNYAKVMAVQLCFFSAYAVFSWPAAKVIEWIGYKRSMVAGLLTMAAGALMFIPAARIPSFPLFLTALVVLAVGIVQLQVAANPYVAVLGPARTSSSRLNLTQAFNSLGTTLAPFFGSALILSTTLKSAADKKLMNTEQLSAYRVEQAHSVITPYFGLAIVLTLLAISIALFRLPKIASVEGSLEEVSHLGDSVWRHRNLVLAAIGIFVYVGGEVSIGSFLINYFHQDFMGGIAEQVAGRLVAFYWGGAMVGRFLGSYLLQRISTRRLLTFNAGAAAALVVISMSTTGPLAMYSILAVGFFNSIMFPSIFTLGIGGLGKLTGEGSAVLCIAIVGGAIIPEIQGVLADTIGIHHAFIIPVLCYAYIAWFGGAAREVGREEAAA
jgi:FHS family L-fucose permease-like MFS transporter